MIVRIYMCSTAKGAKNTIAGYAYVLEADMNGKVATISKTGILRDITRNYADCMVLLEALKRVKPGNTVELFTENVFIKTAIEQWLDQWQQSGWINSKGEPIKEEWQQIAELLQERPINNIFVNDQHEYRHWLQTEAEKEKKNGNEQ